MATRAENGVLLPDTEPRPPVSTLHGGHIAAIDFGTTSCSLAYCLKGDLENMKEKTKIIKLDGVNVRAPTAVLIDHKGKIIMFGRNAEDEWNSICENRKKKDKNFFFKQIKMTLLREKNITATSTIKAANGKECFLIEVIAVMLRYIKDELITVDLEGNSFGIKDASDFNWVITVPAIWKPRAKQMMREAAYLAGIASKGSVIDKLTVVERDVSGYLKTHPAKAERSKTSPDQLSLALEPEGAALYCIHSTKQSDVLWNLKSCLVADIGGGTVDVSAITRSGGGATKVQVALAPAGNDYGGTRVNKAIWEFLGKLVEDPNFEEFSKTRHYVSEMLELEKQIEEKKCEFGKTIRTDRNTVIMLPPGFVETYASTEDSDSDSDDSVSNHDTDRPLDRISESGVSLDGRRMEITYARMEEFFKPALDAIVSCIEKCLRNVKVGVEAVFLVGGFGGCSYIYNKVKPVITCQLYKSPEHTTAVVAGAVMFRKDPEIFSVRIADATYGTSCRMNFNHEKYGHSYDYRVYDDDSVAKCKSLFSAMVTAGETLHRDKIIVDTFTPGSHGTTSMKFDILATEDKKPYYAYTPSGSLKPRVQEIGSITVSMPVQTGDKSRKVKLMFDFSDTEIQVKAHDLTSGQKASTVVDFLDLGD